MGFEMFFLNESKVLHERTGNNNNSRPVMRQKVRLLQIFKTYLILEEK